MFNRITFRLSNETRQVQMCNNIDAILYSRATFTINTLD